MIDLDLLRKPLSDGGPCGPDLDLMGDAGYLNFMARIEGLLPDSYFGFDRSSVDLAAEVETLAQFAERSHDLRILTLLAKLVLLDLRLSAFSSCLATIGWLLDQQWAEVHPVGSDGDLGLRGAVLQTLDDLPHIVLPLQHIPLFQSRRAGTITVRTQMVAAGEFKPRGGEVAVDQSTIDQAIVDCDLPILIEKRDELVGLKASIALIRSAWIANAGFEEAPDLNRLSVLVDKMLAFVDGGVAKRDPSAALGAQPVVADTGESSAESGAPQSVAQSLKPVTSQQEVEATFAAVIRYFAQREPSNPALLLIQQARMLVGRNFIDVLRVLTPENFEDSKIYVGSERQLSFPMGRLSELMKDVENVPFAKSATVAEGGAPDAPVRVVEVGTRPHAVAELEQIAIFYRNTEPSSPIPLLIDRARALVPLDFMTLLREISPKVEG